MRIKQTLREQLDFVSKARNDAEDEAMCFRVVVSLGLKPELTLECPDDVPYAGVGTVCELFASHRASGGIVFVWWGGKAERNLSAMNLMRFGEVVARLGDPYAIDIYTKFVARGVEVCRALDAQKEASHASDSN